MAAIIRHNEFMKTFRLLKNECNNRKIVEDEGEAIYKGLKDDPAAIDLRINKWKKELNHVKEQWRNFYKFVISFFFPNIIKSV